MDVKGIAWVGHLYQKFETMCLEVEDIICQDTIKYVENQVETVGAGVKRFYSDVMQDLLPQSALNDEKVPVFDSALDQYKNVVVCKKPVAGMKIERRKFDEEKLIENSKVIANTKRDIISKLPHGLHHSDNPYSASSQYSVKGAHIHEYSRKHCDEKIDCKLDLDDRESTRKESKHLNKTSITRTYANDASSCNVILNRNCEGSCDQAGKMATELLVKETRCDSAPQNSNDTEIEEVGAANQIGNLSSCVSSTICNAEQEMRLLSNDDLSARLNAADISTIDGSVTVIKSSLNEDVQLNPNGRSDAWSVDESKSDAILKHGAQNVQQTDMTNLDEACVLVNEDDFCFDSHEEARSRPYKKKISRALSFIKKSKRKQEYEELAVWHGYGFGRNLKQQHETNLAPKPKKDEQKQNEDVSEHDWQLL